MEHTEVTTAPAPVLVNGENETSNYVAVRYNAMKHGILSKHVILPHENKNEFDYLLDALVSEHQPSGATEAHLIEELAGIMWRKRRVLLAEGAKFNRGLRRSLHSLDSRSNTTVKDAVPADPALAGAKVDFRDLMSMTQEELNNRKQEALRDLEATEKADQILYLNKTNGYAKALKALLPDTRDWWQDQLDEGEAEATPEALRDFIVIDLLPFCRNDLAAIRHHEAIKQQVIGEGINVPIMESLSRYETHLDRKFERILAMLIKLKELRGKK